jgi:hypothetical protein
LRREERASLPLAGGILQHGYQCGALWGAAFAAGAQAHELFGPGPRAEAAAVLASQKLVAAMQRNFKEINCAELTDTNWKKPSTVIKYFIKGGTLKCFGLVSKFSRLAFDEINTVLSGQDIPDLSPPVSCASELIKKMGGSDLQATMAAGLAGGIGLSGSGCGALGAAIWLGAMDLLKEPKGKITFSDPRLRAIVDKYFKVADYELECAEVVGRKFEDALDHAAYIKDGGCSGIIEALASK